MDAVRHGDAGLRKRWEWTSRVERGWLESSEAVCCYGESNNGTGGSLVPGHCSAVTMGYVGFPAGDCLVSNKCLA